MTTRGPSLRQSLALGPFVAEEAAEYLARTCLTLAGWHARGVFHGDLTPDHLFSGGDIIPAAEGASPSPHAHSRAGPTRDLHSLGVILYEMLTGRIPPALPPVPAVRPRGLDAILWRLLSPGSNDGYSSVASLRTDLLGPWRGPDFVAASSEAKPVCQPGLVGREEELLAVQSRLRQRAGATWIVAAPGMGKTFFVDQLKRLALADGYCLWHLSCQPSAHHNPFSDLARQLLPRLREDADFAARLRAELGSSLPTLVRLLPTLADLGTPESRDLPEAFAGARSREALARLLLGLGSDAVLFVEDMHWALPELMEVISSVQNRGIVQMLLTCREALPISTDPLVLHPLEPPDIHRLMRSMMGPVEPGIALRVSELSGGNPLLASALTRQFKEVGQFAWGHLSPAGESLLRERVLSLPDITRRVLARATLQGARFEAALLGPAAGPHLQRAEDLGMILRESRDFARFSHHLFSEECNRCLSDDDKRAVHLQLADEFMSRQPQPIYEIAHHLWEAGERDLALPWVLRAAAQAREHADLAAAAHFLSRAVQTDDSHWLALAEVERLRGRWSEALEGFGKALASADNPTQRAFVEGKLGETLWRSGDLPAAASYFKCALQRLGYKVPSGWRRSLALVRELASVFGITLRRAQDLPPLSDEEALAAQLLDQLAYTSAYSDGVGLIWANLRSLRLTQNARPGVHRGVVLASHAVAVLSLPACVPRSRRSIQEAVELLQRCGTRHDLECAQARYACILLFTGELEEAARRGRAALAWLESSGDRYDVGICRYNLALTRYWQGSWKEAAHLARQGWQQGSETGDRLAAVYSARVLAALGETPEDFYLRYGEPDKHPHVEMLRWEVLGLLQLSGLRPGLAATYLEEALQRARALGSVTDQCWISLWLATAHRHHAEQSPLAQRPGLFASTAAAARGVLKNARKAYRSFEAHALRELAWSELGRGRNAAAADLFASSETQAEARGQLAEAALTVMEAVRAGLAPDRVPEARHWAAQYPAGWQTPALPDGSGQALARRFEQVVEHGLAVLRCSTTAEVLARTQLAVIDVLGCEECHPIPSRISEPALVVEPGVASALVFPLGVGPALRCAHRFLPHLFGPEELRLAAFLGALAGAAYQNVELLQQALEERVRLQDVFAALPIGVARLDRAGRVVECNPALRAMLGDEVAGAAFADFVFRDERETFRAELQRLNRGDSRPWRSEQRYLGPRNNLVWGQVSLSPLDGEYLLLGLADVSSDRLERIATFQESERRLLGIELHDVSQPLLGLSYQLQAQGLTESRVLVERLIQDMRNLMFDLRTPTVDSFSLKQSISDVMFEMGQMCQVDVQLQLDDAVSMVTGLPALFAYRIIVEGMSNVRRHAHAGRVLLRVQVRDGKVCGSLVDDGRGPAPGEARRRRYGLQGIADRAALLGGWARLRHQKKRGTVLHFRIPFEQS
jgi:PAS domain S-box-containing protein